MWEPFSKPSSWWCINLSTTNRFLLYTCISLWAHFFFFFNSTRTNEPIENDESADERSTTALESKMLFLFF